ncbi:hypothetical protein SSCG_00126 [Streptomyces clavuligerus]|nr:hypothetical protein SSCG_00126 [Streptomyces clavuligerus]
MPLATLFAPFDGDALEHPPQAEGRQEQVGGMRPGTTLTDLREQWIREICTGLVDPAGKESALGPTSGLGRAWRPCLASRSGDHADCRPGGERPPGDGGAGMADRSPSPRTS